MFYSPDLLLRKDARFSLIWRLAITNGNVGGTKKRQILAVNISSIVAELQQRIPTQPLTADQQKNCFSLRLISQLLHGTCIVLQYQFANLHVDAKHVWDSCRHIRFNEKEKHTKRRKREKGDDEIDWEMPVASFSKKRKIRSDFDRTEMHESPAVMGMEFLDRALVTSRSAYDIANITLPDETMHIGAGMNDPLFIQPDEDLIPTTDAMMDAFLNGDDTTFTTKEASETRSGELLKDISSFNADKVLKGSREERAASETVERHRASSHFSHISVNQSGTVHEPLMDDMMMIDDLNLSSSMAGIEGDTRTSIPPHFVFTGPLAISTQVDPALEPILPSEPSQILPIDNYTSSLDAPVPPEISVHDVSGGVKIPSEIMDDDAKRASAGSEELSRNIMGDTMIADEMENQTRGRRKEELRESSYIADIPEVKRRKEDRAEGDEEEEEKDIISRAPKPLKLDGASMKDQMADYSDTLVGRNGRRVKIGDKRKQKPSELFKTIPSLVGKHIAKNTILNDLFKLLKVDKIKLIDGHDPLDDDDEFVLESWRDVERERREEEEENENRKIVYDKVDETNQSVQQTRMDDMTTMIMDNVTMDGVEGVDHMSLATIEGNWEERNEYMDVALEHRLEERNLDEEERMKLMEQREIRKEDEVEEMEEARRRRTTGNYTDGMRVDEPIDLIDQFPTMMMDETRRSEGRLQDGEMREDREGMELMDKVEWRMEADARVDKIKRSTMAQVENREAKEIILSACQNSEAQRVTLEECIPLGANKATAARMFYNLLVLAKERLVVPDQAESYGTILIGLCGDKYQFPIYEENEST